MTQTKTLSLDGSWQLTFGPQFRRGAEIASPQPPSVWRTIEAIVPGNVELDLIRAGLLPPDLERGDNVRQVRKFEEYQWWHKRRFAAPAPQPGERAELVLDGIDCVSTIWLNGKPVGRADNMLIPHRFDVTGLLVANGENELVVIIDSAVLDGRRQPAAPGEFVCDNLAWEALRQRKPPHMYGCDGMPRIVSAGLWRGARLEIVPSTHWRTVYLTTISANAEQRAATLLLDWDFATDRMDIENLRVSFSLCRNGRAEHSFEYRASGAHGRAKISLVDVDLWWPRGQGAPNLYEAELALIDAKGAQIDVHKCRVGLRTMELRRADSATPTHPGDFLFVVNGRKVPARGVNWGPLDAFHSRDTLRLATTFETLIELNCNMARCRGGNVYEDDAFFDLCDQNGIMVWQDFALARAVYPQTDDFAARIREEAEAVVARLRNHACLAVWCGGDQTDEAREWAGLSMETDSDRPTRQVLPCVVRQFDPFRTYLPNSPCGSREAVSRAGTNDITREGRPLGRRDHQETQPRPHSPPPASDPTGYFGCPDRASLELMLDSDHLWPAHNDQQWAAHAARTRPSHDVAGTDCIAQMSRQIQALFGAAPDNLDDYVFASQAAQAEALKLSVERHRSGNWRGADAQWWTVRDGWPAISDAVTDFYGRKKLACQYLKRAQADVCAICADHPSEDRHEVIVINDTPRYVSGQVVITDADEETMLFTGSYDAPPDGKVVIGSIPRSGRQTLWLIEWTEDSQVGRNHYLAGPAPFQLSDYRRWIKMIGFAQDDLQETRKKKRKG